MAEPQNSLRDLFAPPPGMHGTQLLLCGMTAHVTTLNQILEAFTADVAQGRRAHPHLHGLLLLDASHAMLPLSAVPRLFHVPPPATDQWRRRTTLLHAKVALLGFSERKFGATQRFRLIVSTANWTSESFAPGGQIDMVWVTEGTATQRGKDGWRDCAAAYGFFRRLLEQLYGFDYSALPGAQEWFGQWDRLFPQNLPSAGPHFIHSLDRTLFKGIQKKFPCDGYGTLVAGSGFYETGAPTSEPPTLAQIGTLKDGQPAERFLVVNPRRAGAVASWLQHDRTPCWTPCKPIDPVAKRGGHRTDLHAKFIAAVHGDHIKAMYLGSGNLTHKGLFSQTRLTTSGSVKPGKREVGNIEAGVVFTPREQPEEIWKALACGEKVRSVSQFEPGEQEASLVPEPPPPILLMRQVDDRLVPEWASGTSHAEWNDGDRWHAVRHSETLPCAGRVPPFIVVRHDAHAAPYETPVITADGSFGRLPGVPMSGNDIINAIADFPRIALPMGEEPGEQADSGEQNDEQPADLNSGARKAGRSRRTTKYPLKTLMTMIETIAEQNQCVSKEQFPIWLSLLRTMLCDQLGQADQAALQAVGINPFPVLLQPGFLPPCIVDGPPLERAYRQLLTDMAKRWRVAGYPVPGRRQQGEMVGT